MPRPHRPETGRNRRPHRPQRRSASPAPHSKRTARGAAAQAIARTAEHFPDAPPSTLHTDGLSPADAALATAIHRTTLQRWLTIEHLIHHVSKQPLARMEPPVVGILLTGGAQLLFMQGLAAYAVVDEAVKLAGRVAPRAKGLVNAVLRRLAEMPGEVTDRPWEPARDALPTAEGGTMRLTQPWMPHPANLVKHLPAATSVPEGLAARWISVFGAAEATRLAVHSIQVPPTVVVVEPGFDRSQPSELWAAHEAPDSVVWRGPHEKLMEFVREHPRRRVQDPASVAAAAAARDLRPRVILDYCAGLGTKTRQLATEHPEAQVIATDVHDERRATLRELPQTLPNVRVVEPEEALSIRCDLLLLDVPCSNTGVLTRRPEARYRFNAKTLGDLVTLQREIVERTLPLVEKGGHVLYTSCSIDDEENARQAHWIAQRTGGAIVKQDTILPAGRDTTYHDGSYHALIRLP